MPPPLNVDIRAHPRALRQWAADSSTPTLELAKSETMKALERFSSDDVRFYLRRFLAIVEEEMLERLSPAP